MKESIDLCGKCYVPSIFNCTEFPPHLPEWKDWLNRSADTIKVIEFAFIVIVLKGRGGGSTPLHVCHWLQYRDGKTAFM